MRPAHDPVREDRRRRWEPQLPKLRANGERLAALYDALFELDDGARLPWGATVDDALATALRNGAHAAERARDFDRVDQVAAAIRAAVAKAGSA